jgi:predicted nucleic acid-binding Zn ribbon protein
MEGARMPKTRSRKQASESAPKKKGCHRLSDSKNAHRRVLAEWRGIDLGELEKAATPSARPIGSVMPGVLKSMGLDRRRTEAEILRVWNHLIDPNIVAHAQPTGLRNGTLFVTVDHSVWLSEIVRYRRKEILEQLQHGFGSDLIARISFRVG